MHWLNHGSQGRLLRARVPFPNICWYSAGKKKYALYEQPAFQKNFCHEFFSPLFIHCHDTSHTVCPSYSFCILKNPPVLGEPFQEWVTWKQYTQTLQQQLKYLRLLNGDNSRVMILLFLFCKLAEGILYDINLITLNKCLVVSPLKCYL